MRQNFRLIDGGGFDQGPSGPPIFGLPSPSGVPVQIGPVIGGATGGGYQAPPQYVGQPYQVNPPMPVTGAPVPVGADPTTGATGAPTPPASSSGGLGIDLSSISGLLSGSIFGIPISYIGIGLILYFFVFKKGRR